MQTCSCGDLAENGRHRCARCSALDVLGLDSTATREQIKEIYRTLVKVWHPDRFQGDPNLKEAAEARLKAINAAYVFLTSKAGERAAHRPQPTARARANPRPRPRPARGPFSSVRMPSLTKLLGLATLACGLLIGVLLLKAADSYLAAQPITGRFYTEVRDGVTIRFEQAARGLWTQTGQSLHGPVPQKTEVAAPPSVEAAERQPSGPFDSPHLTQNLHRRELGAAHAEPARLTSYITTGLTEQEVKAMLGAPTASSDDKLVYGASELDFTGNKLSGWKIDPATSPIRVKLWPDAPVDPNLTFFAVGSSKSAVLLVQGTPTFLSQNQFGYGDSRVFFENNRVVSWKNDPATVPLHTAP
jgi:DnaJ domain